ncbi:hypothetical protein B0O80DRAFT_470263 [Mortierella sp. GBAus27b]|nr:hypothetical protein BGX31_002290 [Mortierella sp. GBA43]KAI8346059.1 hypothetical protein B0O80DRAFT_470263 [Mortierella sp. GBAus27b]
MQRQPSTDQDHSFHEQQSDQDNPLIHLTPAQRRAAIDNLDIETADRVRNLRASIEVLKSSLRFRCEAELNRLPAAVRAMTVEEFLFKYDGSVEKYLERQAAEKSVADTSFLHKIESASRQSIRPESSSDTERQRRLRPFVNLTLEQRGKKE